MGDGISSARRRSLTAPDRPDPTPLRLALGIGGLAATSALVTAIVAPGGGLAPAVGPGGASLAGTRSAAADAANAAGSSTVVADRPVQYVQLLPGESAPPGATVIDAKAPKPITVVTQVPAPAQQPLVIRTTQSGRTIP